MKQRLLLGCGLPLIIVGMLTFLGMRSLLKPTVKTERSEVVGRGDVEIKVVETGTVEPLRKVDLKSKVGGRIARLLVDENTYVRQGQPLATIDPQEINSEVAALRAQLAAARARLASAQKGALYQRQQTIATIAQNEHNVASARAHLQQLETESGVQPKLTGQDIEVARANLDAAKANLEAQEASLNLMVQTTHPQDIVSAQAAYDQARAQSDNAAHNVRRQQQLVAKGFVAQSVVESAETDANVAEAHMRDVKQHLDTIRQTNLLQEANARAQVASARGQMRQMEAALVEAQASVLPITKQRELESARAAYAQALAQLDAARAGATQDAMRKDDAAAAAADAQQIVNQLKEKLVSQGDTTLVASMSGLVTKRYVEQGELISSAIDTFSAGSPVYQISDIATMLVKININEVDIAKVKRGLLTEVTTDASKGSVFLGHVDKVAAAALTDSSATSGSNTQTVIRFPVVIRINRADPRLKPGMSARCSIIADRRKNVLRLPTNCVQGSGANATVQVVTKQTKDGATTETTLKRAVKVGLQGDDFVEILSGLKEGERVRPNPYTGPPRKTIDMNN